MSVGDPDTGVVKVLKIHCRINGIERSLAFSDGETFYIRQFADIFTKIAKIESKPLQQVCEVWKQIEPDVYKCKVTNKKLSKIQFLRYQDAMGGSLRFVVEVMPLADKCHYQLK